MVKCSTKQKLMETVSQLIWSESFGSVSVDDICKQAGVNKGSFYHFFPSKVDAALAALDYSWSIYEPQLNTIFAITKDPLQRLDDYCDFMYHIQAEKYDELGEVCGCPQTRLGMESGEQGDKLRQAVQAKMAIKQKYLEVTLVEAKRLGLIDADHPKNVAEELYAYALGMIMQAKINNDLTMVKKIKEGFWNILRLKSVV